MSNSRSPRAVRSMTMGTSGMGCTLVRGGDLRAPAASPGPGDVDRQALDAADVVALAVDGDRHAEVPRQREVVVAVAEDDADARGSLAVDHVGQVLATGLPARVISCDGPV